MYFDYKMKLFSLKIFSQKLKMIVMQIIFFELKEIFICETTHVTGAQNFLSHNKMYGTR